MSKLEVPVRPLAEKLLLSILVANIIFFLKEKDTNSLCLFLLFNMPARGRLLARRSLETSPNSTPTTYAQRGFIGTTPNYTSPNGAIIFNALK